MNEPAFFGVTKILPRDFSELPAAHKQYCLHKTEDGEVPHLEVRNLYGFLMSRATHEGLLSQRPNERPFVLTRSATAGIQRYAAVWLGDNKSRYEHLRKSIPMLLNMGLSGVAFAGVDIGGWGEDALPEILIRWYELGVFYPFFRNHNGLSDRGQEPYAYAPGVEQLITKLIEARYQLLPYINTLFWEQMRSGSPLMRPLLWHYPNDPVAADIDDQFLFGENIMVTPILERAQEYRTVYFPEGNWYHFSSNKKYVGNQVYSIQFPLGGIPAFVREGTILPTTESMQHTNHYADKPIIFKIYGETASCNYFEDDGKSFDYEKGKYNEFKLHFKEGKLTRQAINNNYKTTNKYFYEILEKEERKPISL